MNTGTLPSIMTMELTSVTYYVDEFELELVRLARRGDAEREGK